MLMTDQPTLLPGFPGSARPGTRRVWLSWRHLAYFLGVPLTIAVYAGLNNWEMQNIAGFRASIVFYLAHSVLPWCITCLVTTLLMKLLERWKPPWLLLLLLGHTLGCFIVLPYSNWLTALYAERWPELAMAVHFSPDDVGGFGLYWLRAGLIWIGVNYLFDQFLGLPLYRYAVPRGYDSAAPGSLASTSAGADEWLGRAPGFIERLPARLGPSEVLAIKAEQHYIRVYSPQKEYMVLYRFSDAIRELDESLGHQVHRSYWVNTGAIDHVHAKAKDFHVRIKSGAEIPVSTPYQGMVRELTRSARLATRG
jgi:hypothetical protein